MKKKNSTKNPYESCLISINQALRTVVIRLKISDSLTDNFHSTIRCKQKYPLLLKTDSLHINVALTHGNHSVKLTALPFYEWRKNNRTLKHVHTKTQTEKKMW